MNPKRQEWNFISKLSNNQSGRNDLLAKLSRNLLKPPLPPLIELSKKGGG